MIKKLSFVIIFIIVFSFTCRAQVSKDDFIISGYNKFEKDLLTKYKRLAPQNLIDNPVNFIALYHSYCATPQFKKEDDYKILQAFYLKNRQLGCYYELLSFKDKTKMDTVVNQMISNNCIEVFNLRIKRIYQIGKLAIICLNYYSDFDIRDFEDFLNKEFNGNVKMEVMKNNIKDPGMIHVQ